MIAGLLLPALCFTVVTLLSLWLLRRRPPPAVPKDWPPVVILRPCQGTEPLLEQNLLSSVRACYRGPRRVLFLVPDQGDPAHQVAQEAARRCGAQAEVVVTAISPGGNRKVAQLCAAESLAREEVLITVDSDVLLGDDDLPALVAALCASPSCGAAFASPVESDPRTWADRASAALLNGSHQNFMALYALSTVSGGTPSLAGALCAYRREALSQIGGFAGLRPYLGEDHEAARRLRQAGWTIALSRQAARCTDGGRTAAQVVARVARWLMVVRSQRPGLLLSYPLLLAALPPGLLLAAGLRSLSLLLLCLLLLGLRAGLAIALRQAHGLGPRPWRGVPSAVLGVLLAEGLLWLALVRVLRHRRIEWRGHRYRLGRGGVLLAE